ncbi:MAG TPA: tetraacyldisaccharide 4'-kinase [Lichenihabitans sp.]|jgi:tetraacyldisaccharide 4'-kinase|nr:tetraacyldisaccharide 4'-kinase [Lichenihabitans sp.]
MIETPRFWWRPDQVWAKRLLAPAGALYGAVTARRMARPGRRLDRPVICVGNVVAGGAGKTPTVLWLVERLEARGQRPVVLSRGYGRQRGDGDEVIRVDGDRHTAREVGDEPLLIARTAPCFVAADRRRAAEAAVASGGTVLLLDDGLQNPSLTKTASIAVVDGTTGIGNGACLPAGPLRAPLGRQLPFVSLILVLGDGAAGDGVAAEAGRQAVAVARGDLRPDARALQALRGRRLVAFAGLGRPDKFFRTLEEAGLDLVGRSSFPDHHPFREVDLARLLASARQASADLVTTEKDRVRLPADFPALTLPVSLDIEDPAPLDAMLDRALAVTPGA